MVRKLVYELGIRCLEAEGMNERRVTSAEDASEIVRNYAEKTSLRLSWLDVVECEYNEGSEEWRVVYEASPSLASRYYRYEAIIDANTAKIKSVKRFEK